ncbi:MAG: thioredoxin [Actinobacteria bacterium]|nr:thioredoxin [Actinomycetota bacterium]MBU4241383.1 thioredoxin [Actinomycetota bacterium]MBU4301753.1 thioredoxin [Actinomycetota bacterium]MBU4490657.1 thioredoxin [Actinomycetota bacterium]MCG2794292.1 thioredoxin [Actinomycetes bacterium]
MGEVVEIDDKSFEAEIIKTEKPALVDFWAPWCGPCRMMHPILEGLANEYEGKAVIARCNVDDNQELAGRFDVTAIPTLVMFKGGQQVDKMIGIVSAEDLGQRLDANL